MKIINIKDYIKKEFELYMTLNGFHFVKKDFAFKKNIGKFKSEIYFLTNSWGYEVELMPYVGISHPFIENICNRINYNIAYTTYLNLFVLEQINKTNNTSNNSESIRYNLQLKRKDRFELSDWQGIDTIQPRLTSLMNLAVTFINNHSNFKYLNKLYNSNPYEEYNQFCIAKHMHFFVGLILAWLCKKDYSHFKSIYKQRIMEEIDSYELKDSFDKLIQILDNNDISININF